MSKCVYRRINKLKREDAFVPFKEDICIRASVRLLGSSEQSVGFNPAGESDGGSDPMAPFR